MYTQQKPFAMVAATPIHAGSGTQLSIVDLPIQREQHTGYPKIEGSTIKGALRESFRRRNCFDDEIMNIVMGPEQGDLNQAALGIMDCRLLFFPVKSVQGVYAMVTCDDILSRFGDAMQMAGIDMQDNQGVIDLNSICDNCITESSEITLNINGRKDVVIEETLLRNVEQSPDLTRFAAWFRAGFLAAPQLATCGNGLAQRLLKVDNDTFTGMVELYTEVIARNRIDPETGTVKSGQLWYEEYLPSESILYSMLSTARPFVLAPPDDLVEASDVLERVTGSDIWPNVLQLGGNQSIGKGYMKLGLYREEE